MSPKIASEPVAIPCAIMAVVVAGLGLAVLFGAPLSAVQIGGIVTFVGAVIALVTAYQRQRPVSASDVADKVEGRIVSPEKPRTSSCPAPRSSELGDHEPQHTATPTYKE